MSVKSGNGWTKERDVLEAKNSNFGGWKNIPFLAGKKSASGDFFLFQEKVFRVLDHFVN